MDAIYELATSNGWLELIAHLRSLHTNEVAKLPAMMKTHNIEAIRYNVGCVDGISKVIEHLENLRKNETRKS